MKSFVVATVKEWNIKNYFNLKELLKDQYHIYLITDPHELTPEYLKEINPVYIFFPHWSHKIERNIYEAFECVIFHETALPYGRGGSPIQNLILHENYHTKISAIKCSEKLDAGEIYMQKDFDLCEGSAETIYESISELVFLEMIPYLLKSQIQPKQQEGETTHFKRRKPEQSDITLLDDRSLKKLYDFIRMLDAPSYPKAYLMLEEKKIHFFDVSLEEKRLYGRFKIDE